MNKEDQVKMHAEMDRTIEDRCFNSETVRDAVFFDILVSEGMYNVPETISDNDLDRAIARLEALSYYKKDINLWEYSEKAREENQKEIDIVDEKLSKLKALRDKRDGKEPEISKKSNCAKIAILEEMKAKILPFMEENSWKK